MFRSRKDEQRTRRHMRIRQRLGLNTNEQAEPENPRAATLPFRQLIVTIEAPNRKDKKDVIRKTQTRKQLTVTIEVPERPTIKQ